jgi:hypothetical protein
MRQSKLITFLGLVIVVLVVGIGYQIYRKFRPGSPYPAGTIITQAKEGIPAGFPGELLTEGAPLRHSDTVTYPDGKTDMTVDYITNRPVLEVLSVYRDNLRANSWIITRDFINQSGVIIGAKGQDRLAVTVSPDEKGSLVTVLYQK